MRAMPFIPKMGVSNKSQKNARKRERKSSAVVHTLI
jgi:hypothetical protein